MRRYFNALLILASLLPHSGAAQSANPAAPKAPVEKPEKKSPPTQRDFARQLLESAHDAAGRAQPGAQAALLAQIGDCFIVFDRKLALTTLEQAFPVAGQVSGADPFAAFHSSLLQTSIVQSVADLDLSEAAEMTRSMPPDNRARAIETVVAKLVGKGDFETAIEVVNLGSGAKYPFSAAATILDKLNDDDPRAAIVFGAALSGFQTSPDRAFGQMLAAHWKHLPVPTVRQALDAIIAKVATYKEDASIFKISLAGANGSADLNTEQEIELFDVAAPLEALEPGKLAELYQTYPALKKAYELFPDGQFTTGTAVNYTAGAAQKGSRNPEDNGRSALFDQSMKLKQQAQAMAAANLPSALDLTKTIPLAVYQAATLSAIAEQRIESETASARDLLNRSLAILAKCDVDPYGDGVAQNEVAIAGDAHKLNDDELTRHALSLAFDTAAKFAAWDFSADDPNELPEDMWPSTYSYQNAMRKAAQIYKQGAASYLNRIQNTDMFLFSQVALAAALLDRQQQGAHGSHVSKQQKPPS